MAEESEDGNMCPAVTTAVDCKPSPQNGKDKRPDKGADETENNDKSMAKRSTGDQKVSSVTRDNGVDNGDNETGNKDKSPSGRRAEGCNTSPGTRSLGEAIAGAIQKRARIPTGTSAEDPKESAKNRDRSLDEGDAKTEIRDESAPETSAVDRNTSKVDRNSSSDNSSAAMENKGNSSGSRSTNHGNALPGVTGRHPYKHTATENEEDRMQAGESTALAGTKSKCPDKGAGATKNKGKSSGRKSAVAHIASEKQPYIYTRNTATENEEDKIPSGICRVDDKAQPIHKDKSLEKSTNKTDKLGTGKEKICQL